MCAAAVQPKITDCLEQLRSDLPWLHRASMKQALAYYDGIANAGEARAERIMLAELGRKDRFFLLTHLLHRIDAIHPWLYARIREVEADPDGHLDLWARDHYKSTMITFAGSIQEVLNDPEMTVAFFSHARPISKAFLEQVKIELETNDDLKSLYPEILYRDPKKESPGWSLDDGLLVRRRSNPKERTFEAWGLVDGQPVGKHFRLAIFDDIVTLLTVNTVDQIVRTLRAWEHAQNLLTSRAPRRWMTGTTYKYGDPYHQLRERKAAIPRIYPATDNGTIDGKPVFLSEEVWKQKVKESSIETIASQQLINPAAGTTQEFKPEWVRNYEVRPQTLNVYILGDYAGSRKSTGSSRTAIAALGYDVSRNVYLLDAACHKMDLSERWTRIRDMRKRFLNEPGIQIVDVGYERFGAQSDIEHFQTMMEIEKEFFDIRELNWPRESDVAKDNRIRRLVPDAKNWRLFLPAIAYDAVAQSWDFTYPKDGQLTKRQREVTNMDQEYLIAKPIMAINEEKKLYNVVEYLIRNEWLFFPFTVAKDLLDAMSRIYDMEPVPPMLYSDADILPPASED